MVCLETWWRGEFQNIVFLKTSTGFNLKYFATGIKNVKEVVHFGQHAGFTRKMLGISRIVI